MREEGRNFCEVEEKQRVEGGERIRKKRGKGIKWKRMGQSKRGERMVEAYIS